MQKNPTKNCKPVRKQKDEGIVEVCEITKSCGNIYKDVGMPHPEEAQAKAKLAVLITKTIKEQRLTQSEAAEKMGIDQPKVSKIMTGVLSNFSIQRLMHFVLCLGFDIELSAKQHKTASTRPAIHVI